jgi:hypothetical protein
MEFESLIIIPVEWSRRGGMNRLAVEWDRTRRIRRGGIVRSERAQVERIILHTRDETRRDATDQDTHESIRHASVGVRVRVCVVVAQCAAACGLRCLV